MLVSPNFFHASRTSTTIERELNLSGKGAICNPR
jgi:hypothetical protein